MTGGEFCYRPASYKQLKVEGEVFQHTYACFASGISYSECCFRHFEFTPLCIFSVLQHDSYSIILNICIVSQEE